MLFRLLWSEWRDSFASAPKGADKGSARSNPRRRRSSAPHLFFRVSHHTNKKVQNPHKRILDFWSEWRDSNSRHPGPKRIREFFLTFLAPFNTFIHSSRWYSELSSPLIPSVFSVVVVKTVVKNDCPPSRIRFGFRRYCGQNCGQVETA